MESFSKNHHNRFNFALLNSQLDQLKREMNPSASPAGMPLQNGAPIMFMMRPPDNYTNSYTQPPKPSVTILKRPTHQQNENKATDMRPKQPIKSLKQREQEYAEARLRILGSAKNPEDELEASTPKVVTKISETTDENYRNLRLSSDSYSSSLSVNGQVRLYDNNVVRMPRGPDGSSGFNIRR